MREQSTPIDPDSDDDAPAEVSDQPDPELAEISPTPLDEDDSSAEQPGALDELNALLDSGALGE